MRLQRHIQQPVELKLPAILSLALLVVIPVPALSQLICDQDGVNIVFLDEVAGSLQLREASARELSGPLLADRTVDVGRSGGLSGRLRGRTINSATAGFSRFNTGAAGAVGFQRILPDAWEARFPPGMYEFQDRADLRLEIAMIIADRQASHFEFGSDSAVTVEVEEGRIQRSWYQGTNSLRSLRGSLELRISDLERLVTAGTHRAMLSVCVNVRSKS